MATIREAVFYKDGGAPRTGLTPTVLAAYKAGGAALSGPELANILISELGNGLYLVSVANDPAFEFWAIIDAGVDLDSWDREVPFYYSPEERALVQNVAPGVVALLAATAALQGTVDGMAAAIAAAAAAAGDAQDAAAAAQAAAEAALEKIAAALQQLGFNVVQDQRAYVDGNLTQVRSRGYDSAVNADAARTGGPGTTGLQWTVMTYFTYTPDNAVDKMWSVEA